MTPREAGFLLLSSKLGDPDRRPLSTAQLRQLAQRVTQAGIREEDRDLTQKDLVALGYRRDMADRIVKLLEDNELLKMTLRRAESMGCVPVTRVNPRYPVILRRRLGLESPGCLWARGDLSLLDTPAISLVGSRDLGEMNRTFACAVGRQAAEQGITLVSGNARGADRTAQEACLEAGGKVISVVADSLKEHSPRENILYLSEEDYDADFSVQRALSRNRCIHALGRLVFVAQCTYGQGGTWSGTLQNLRHGWSNVVCFRDGSPASQELEQMGAYLIGMDEISDFSALQQQDPTFF